MRIHQDSSGLVGTNLASCGHALADLAPAAACYGFAAIHFSSVIHPPLSGATDGQNPCQSWFWRLLFSLPRTGRMNSSCRLFFPSERPAFDKTASRACCRLFRNAPATNGLIRARQHTSGYIKIHPDSSRLIWTGRLSAGLILSAAAEERPIDGIMHRMGPEALPGARPGRNGKGEGGKRSWSRHRRTTGVCIGKDPRTRQDTTKRSRKQSRRTCLTSPTCFAALAGPRPP